MCLHGEQADNVIVATTHHLLTLKLQDGKVDLWKYGRIHQDIEAQARNETPNDTCVACRSFPHSKVSVQGVWLSSLKLSFALYVMNMTH